MMLSRFAYLLFGSAMLLLASTAAESNVSKGFLRSMLETEKECKDSRDNIKPGRSKKLKSRKCDKNAVLQECTCTSDNPDIIGFEDSSRKKDDRCLCIFRNDGDVKLKKVNLEACAICVEQADECQTNADCANDTPFCKTKGKSSICVECIEDEDCGEGNDCKKGVCKTDDD